MQSPTKTQRGMGPTYHQNNTSGKEREVSLNGTNQNQLEQRQPSEELYTASRNPPKAEQMIMKRKFHPYHCTQLKSCTLLFRRSQEAVYRGMKQKLHQYHHTLLKSYTQLYRRTNKTLRLR